jgi:hypothetical protein
VSRQGIEGILSDELWRHINGEPLEREWTRSQLKRKSPNQTVELAACLFIQGDPKPLRDWFAEQRQVGHMTKEPLTTIYSPMFVPAVLVPLTSEDTSLAVEATEWWQDHLYLLSLHETKNGEVWTPGARTFAHDESRDAMFAMAVHGKRLGWRRAWGDTPGRDAGAVHRLLDRLPRFAPPDRLPKLKDRLTWFRTEQGWASYPPRALKGCWSDPCFGVSEVDGKIHALRVRHEGEPSRLLVDFEGDDLKRGGKVWIEGGRLHAAVHFRVKRSGQREQWHESIPMPGGRELERVRMGRYA